MRGWRYRKIRGGASETVQRAGRVELISVLIAVLAIGVAQSGLILTSNRGLREDMARMEPRLREDMKQLAERVARVEHSQAKLEGLLEGLREAITGRSAAG